MKTDLLHNELIQALREELLQYGEFLARKDDLRRSDCTALPVHARAVQAQKRVLQYYRRIRTELQQSLAQALGLPENTPAAQLVRHLPSSGCRTLVSALLEEQEALSQRLELEHN